MPTNALRGFTVVVTRPEHQAQALRAAIEAAGGTVILFPVLEIAEAENLATVRVQLARIAEFDIAVFISPNAVEYGLRELARVGGVPRKLIIGAVGAGTARALDAAGHPAQLVPQTEFNSEALLALDALHHVAGKKIIIFRGVGGREHLATTLRQRGAQVEYAEVYRRLKPSVAPQTLLDAWATTGIDAVVVTSNEGLQNFYDIISARGQQHLRDTPLLVASQRAAELVHKLGIERDPIVVTPVSDAAIVQTLLHLAQTSRTKSPLPGQGEG